MRLHLPLLFLLEFTGSASGLKISPRSGNSRRTNTSCTPLKATAGRGGSKVPRKERTSAPDGSKDTREAWRWGGFVRPEVNPASKKNKNKSSSSDAGNNNDKNNNSGDIGTAGSDTGTAMAILSQTTEVVVATIVSTGAANALLTPLHRWSSSRKRVAEAVEAAAAAKRRRQQQQRALFDQQQQQEDGTTTTNPWVELLRAALPQPVKKTYSTVAAVPGQLAKSSEQAAASLSAARENLASVAEAVAAAPDRARGAATQALEMVKTARQAITEAPGRVEEMMAATQELPGRLRQAVGEGAEAVTALEENGRKAAEAAETLPSRCDNCRTIAMHSTVLFYVVLFRRSREGRLLL